MPEQPEPSNSNKTHQQQQQDIHRPSVLGSITGRRSISGTLTATGTGSFEIMSARELVPPEPPADDDAVKGERSRAHTAPDFTENQQQHSTTLHPASSEEDDELRVAKAMALAIQNNPKLTPDEIRQLVASGTGSLAQSQGPAVAKTAPSASLLIPGRLSSMFQAAPAAADTDNPKTPRGGSNSSTGTGTGTGIGSSMGMGSSIGSGSLRSSMSESFQKRKGRLSEILTGGSRHVIVEEPAASDAIAGAPARMAEEIATMNNAPLSNTSASSSKEEKTSRRVSKLLRLPPTSPRPAADDAVVSPKGVLKNLAANPSLDDANSLIPPSLSVQTNDKLPNAAAMAAAAAPLSITNNSTTNKPFSSLDPIRMAGIAWKRRSGLGKYSATSAWERRRIELQGSKLFYYRTEKEAEADQESSSKQDGAGSVLTDSYSDDPKDNEGVVVAKRSNWFEQAAANWTQSEGDRAAPRGDMDLVKEKATLQVALGHSGAPSPFAISIKVRGETKWKFCFDYHSVMMEWLAAMTDVVVQNSIDSYNASLLEAADPSHHTDSSYFPPGTVNEPPTPGGKREAGQHRLWQMEPYTLRSQDAGAIGDEAETSSESDVETTQNEEEEVEDIREVSSARNDASASATASTASSLDPKALQELAESSGKKWNVPESRLLYVAGVLNAALASAQASSVGVEGFWYVFAFANLGLFLCMTKEPDWEMVARQIRAVPAVHIPNGTNPNKNGKTSKSSKASPKGATKQPKTSGFIPVAGTTTVKLKNAADPPENKLKQMFAGWRTIPGEILAVRSHGYSATKKKVPSPGALYECADCDIFESPTRYPDMASRVKLPKVEYDDGGKPKTWRSPDVFVMSIALPTDPPKLGKNSSDGSGYTVTIYFTMTQETRDILRRVTAEGYDPSTEQVDDAQKSIVNAVRLFEEWCRRAPTDPKFMSRFKVVPNAHNLKEIGMPGWISKYNGKPFLIKRPGQTGFLFNHPELSCMEFDISLHPFPYLAKQAICYMKDSYFKKILVSFGFVIEGRADDELPECLIGLMQLCYPDPIHAIQADTFFAGTCNRSF